MTDRPTLRVFTEDEIRKAVDDQVALTSAETAFRALATGRAVAPAPLGMDLPASRGEVHVKGAALEGAPVFAFKVATGFYGNATLGMPTGAGLVLVFDAVTGFPLAVLADNGYLTDLRTAAAGALAVRLLAPDRALRVGVLGAGVQARLQLRLMSRVRSLTEVRVWSPREASRVACAGDLSETLQLDALAVDTPAQAVADADLVVTCTPSREPLIAADMLRAGATVIALGSDGPEKRELAPEVMVSATVVTDHTGQCVRLGELHHAVAEGLMSAQDVHAELGQILVGDRSGRESDAETLVCDLTGVGVQDAAIAGAAWSALTGSMAPL